MQENGENLFLISFPADIDLVEVLSIIIELRQLVKRSKDILEGVCKEHQIVLDECSKTFKFVGTQCPNYGFQGGNPTRFLKELQYQK